MRHLSWLFVSALLVTPCCAQGEKNADPDLPEGPAITFEPAFPAQKGFDRPLYVAFTASDPDHAYVVTQPGQVFAVPRDPKQAERRVFLDLKGKVYLEDWEEGLIGFTFDPGYQVNGLVYAYWTEKVAEREQTMVNGQKAKSNRQGVLSRFTTKDGDGGRVVDLDSELRVLEVFEPFGNHNGGTIEFGPDGMLYLALGDGGLANDPFGDGQSKATLLGKILRLDLRGASKEKPYTIPEDNPFVGEQGARGEIWCYGMRNPWRFTFDRETGDLWCGDVGQNKIEEVDRLVKGGNYGWNAMEGDEPFSLRKPPGEVPANVIAPIAHYQHSEGLSVTGGYVYRGKAIPGLVGCFVYGDFMNAHMWAVKEDRAGGKHRVVTLEHAPQQVSSFAQEPDGELLITGFGGRNGKVWRLVPAKGGDK